jgi:uncharacterized protein YkwD
MPNPPIAARALSRPTRRAQTVLLALAVAAAALVVAAPVQAVGGSGLREVANWYRVQKGHLNPVVGTDLLDDIAVHRAARMADRKELEHDLDYVTSRLNRAGVCWRGYGEIIAWERGYPDYSYERTVKQWWDSDLHREIMMGAAYNAAGGAWATASDGGHYSVMVFAVLCDPSAASSPVSRLNPDDVYNPDRQLVITPGRMTGYRFSSSGQVLAEKTVRFSSKFRGKAGGRAALRGKAWLKVSSGKLDGYWVHESPDAYVRGTTDRRALAPYDRLEMKRGRYVGRTFDWLGRVQTQRTYRFDHSGKARVTSRAIINGRRYYLLDSTRLAGYWIRDSDTVRLR